jgi:hypothetical protein
VGKLKDIVFSIDYTPRQIRINEDILEKLREGAELGLVGESLAYHAGLTIQEYRQLDQLDHRVSLAVVAGKSDGERKLAQAIFDAATNGDSKMALEVLKHRHGWTSTQIVKNEHTGVNGGPIALSAVDFRNLSDDELAQVRASLEKAAKQLPE